MRFSHQRVVTLVGLLCSAAVAVPAASWAAPAAQHRITINAQPNPITAGDPVVVFGRLFGPNHSGRVVKLFHRVAGAQRFSVVSQTVTDSTGAYEFSRADGVVLTNRRWRVFSSGALSRSVAERVRAQVTLHGPLDGSNLLTGRTHPYTFTGTVSPAKAGGRVLLQRQAASSGGEHWTTIGHSQVGSGGQFVIVHHFTVPGDANIRALVLANRQNAASPSSPLTYEISQAQNPALTINASPDPVSAGGSVSITGVLQGGAHKQVTLWARTYRHSFAPVAQASTDAGGNYTFSETPVDSTLYQVRTSHRRSAQLYEGVKDVLSAQASATTVQAGHTVTFSGTVSPDKTGHTIYLQRRNSADGEFHTVQTAEVGAGSSYSIVQRFYDAGTKVMRVLIPGGPDNQGAASGPITITVTPASASALTPPQG